jgi:2-polyprenyl-6-methoxyphenol hydroxylase-like FAD-dependent oxidoreductase
MARNERILIVGGGIAGLTAAIALRRHGFAPELVERAASWRALGTGIVIQPNAMRLLRELGVATHIEAVGATVRWFQYLNKTGEILSKIDLAELWSNVGSGVAIERGELQKALLQSLDGAGCRLGVAITSLSQRAGSVSVGFSDGGAAEYDLVIGADGIGSTTRTLAIGATAPRYCGQAAWRALARSAERALMRYSFGSATDPSLRPIQSAPNALTDVPMWPNPSLVARRLKGALLGSAIAWRPSESRFDTFSIVWSTMNRFIAAQSNRLKCPSGARDGCY